MMSGIRYDNGSFNERPVSKFNSSDLAAFALSHNLIH